MKTTRTPKPDWQNELRRLILIPDLGETALRLGGLQALGGTEAEIAQDLGLTLRELHEARQELARHTDDHE